MGTVQVRIMTALLHENGEVEATAQLADGTLVGPFRTRSVDKRDIALAAAREAGAHSLSSVTGYVDVDETEYKAAREAGVAAREAAAHAEETAEVAAEDAAKAVAKAESSKAESSKATK